MDENLLLKTQPQPPNDFTLITIISKSTQQKRSHQIKQTKTVPISSRQAKKTCFQPPLCFYQILSSSSDPSAQRKKTRMMDQPHDCKRTINSHYVNRKMEKFYHLIHLSSVSCPGMEFIIVQGGLFFVCILRHWLVQWHRFEKWKYEGTRYSDTKRSCSELRGHVNIHGGLLRILYDG